MTASTLSVVMIGGTGAVGSHVVKTLQRMDDLGTMSLLGRRKLEGVQADNIHQHVVDVFDPKSYADHLPGHRSAVCTFGVGEPSKVSKEEFVRIDKTTVLDFASACSDAGVERFTLLSSVGANPKSRFFYLRTKGELEAELGSLGFRRLSLFRPSMILTPTNRYGMSQALALAVWPRLRPFLVGSLRSYRGIRVDRLGRAIALDLRSSNGGTEILHWDEIEALATG